MSAIKNRIINAREISKGKQYQTSQNATDTCTTERMKQQMKLALRLPAGIYDFVVSLAVSLKRVICHDMMNNELTTVGCLEEK